MRQTTSLDIDRVIAASALAAPGWANSTLETRALLLDSLADALDDARQELVELADQETHLGAVRLTGELARTSFQLRRFASEADRAFAFTDDPAVSGPPPAGHPDMVRVRVPVGPVAMFSASNFPFAFSVLGGDTASALAAGCPVVVKAHPGHPRLSRRVHALALEVLDSLRLPAGLVGFIEGAGNEVGVQLIRHPAIAAAAFTGSVRGGLALEREARERPRPIPFYGELGSVNPVLVLPAAIEGREAESAGLLAQSITNGAGQFCTSPGIVVVLGEVASGRFVEELAQALARQTTHPMLTEAIRAGFDGGVRRIAGRPEVAVVQAGAEDPKLPPRPFLARTGARQFIADVELHDEVFGPAALVVEAGSAQEVVEILEAIGGSLTVTIWGVDEPTQDNREIVRAASRMAGRILFAGVPTGVAVTAAQHHGGPYPSSTQPFTTSVGLAALDRFLRPVALQDAPDWIVERRGRPV